MDVWQAVGAFGSLAAAVVGGWVAYQARSAAAEANAAAKTMAQIERDRRHTELCPRLRVSCEPWAPGSDHLRLRVALLGPPGLDRLDTLRVTIRDDRRRRDEGSLWMDGRTREDLERQIWGPYRFMPYTGPDGAQADATGRVTAYEEVLPVGEELRFELEHTVPPHWAQGTSPEDWQRQRGTIIRITFDAQHTTHDSWTLPVEIDVGDGIEPVTVNTGDLG